MRYEDYGPVQGRGNSSGWPEEADADYIDIARVGKGCPAMMKALEDKRSARRLMLRRFSRPASWDP